MLLLILSDIRIGLFQDGDYKWRLFSILAINKRYLLASLYSREEYQKSFPLLMFRKVYVNSETPHSFNSLF